jgi:hypothetical protein
MTFRRHPRIQEKLISFITPSFYFFVEFNKKLTVHSSNGLQLVSKCQFFKCLDFSHLLIAIVILVAMSLVTSLLTFGYCDRARFPLPNIAPLSNLNCMFVPPHSLKLGEAMLKSFIQILVLYNAVEKVVLP